MYMNKTPRVNQKCHTFHLGEKCPAFKKTILDSFLVPVYDAGQKTNIKISQNSWMRGELNTSAIFHISHFLIETILFNLIIVRVYWHLLISSWTISSCVAIADEFFCKVKPRSSRIWFLCILCSEKRLHRRLLEIEVESNSEPSWIIYNKYQSVLSDQRHWKWVPIKVRRIWRATLWI